MILDATNSTWGINVFDRLSQSFVNVSPIIITNNVMRPDPNLGNIGDYAVIPFKPVRGCLSRATYFYKNYKNDWVTVGSPDWKDSLPTVVGNRRPTGLPEKSSFILTLNAEVDIPIVVPSSPNNNIQSICDIINNRKIVNLRAYNDNGRIVIVFSECGKSKSITLSDNNSSLLSVLGLSPGTYFIPEMTYSTDVPPWKHEDTEPHPSGSVWINLNDEATGLQLKVYDNGELKHVYKSVSEGGVAKQLDQMGGINISTGTLFATVNSEGSTPYGSIVLHKRSNTGPTIIKSSRKNPVLTKGSKLIVTVTVPNNIRVLHKQKMVGGHKFIELVLSGNNIESFATDWNSANIPNCTAEVVDGYLQLTHTSGGDIYMVDLEEGQSNNLINQLGFIPYETPNVRYGPCYPFTNSNATQSWTDGNGSGCIVSIGSKNTAFIPSHIVYPGTGYKVGDVLYISGDKVAGDLGKNDVGVNVQQVNSNGGVTQFALHSGKARINYCTVLSYWEEVDYEVQ